MHKNPNSKSGLINPRAVLALALCAFAGSFGYLSFASTPSSGTLTDTSGPITYSAGPFFQTNQSPVGAGQLDTGPRCDTAAFPCDTFHLTVTLPSGYMAAHPKAVVKVTMGWIDAAVGKSDYDLYIYQLPRGDCFDSLGNPSPDCSSTDGNEVADWQSATGHNPEVEAITPTDGTKNYTIHILPSTPTGETVNVKVELLPGDNDTGAGSAFGAADPTVPNVPRYMNFYAPAGSSAESSQGEFNIGYNPATHRIMTMNDGPIWRLTLPEYLQQAKPECCEALWEDKSNATTNIGLDPILWTDQLSGRTFSSNSTVGANVVYGYSDNDGDTWIPVSFSPPNGGADHETIGTGPYPAGFTALGTPVNHGHATYYCSQDIVGPAACYRSDTLGASFAGSTLAYSGSGPQGCGGLHGHLHVAPDGTVWLPVNQCNGHQGGVFSTDAGATWTEFIVPNSLAGGNPATGISQINGADPSIGIDANNRIYYAYVNNQANGTEGHARVATGTLTGCTVNPVTGARSGCSVTWDHDIDIGASHGVINAAEIEATQGGDAGRAAVAFLGTDHNGDYQEGLFPGDWYAFIASTYDNGQTWTTVNATPNDPVQHATGVWQRGGSGSMGDRNLLDFTEITIGDKGQVLYGYSDGCVTPGCINGTAGNDRVAYMRVARQIGGKTMYAANDVNEPVIPKAPCLSGARDRGGSRLTWKVPDNGGALITSYQIFRGTSAGGETLLATYYVSANSKPEYLDTTADPNVTTYYYKVLAVNSKGTGALSNEVALSVSIPPALQDACVGTGLTVLVDATGDSTNPATGTDLISASVAQLPGSADKLTVTIQTVPDPNSTAAHVPGSAWYVAMQVPNGSGGYNYTGVRMEGGVTPSFYSYVPGGNNAGGVDGRFVASKKAADPSSNYNPTTGVITIVAPLSDLGLAPGTVIHGFVSGSSQTTNPAGVPGPTGTELWDSMPDSLAFTNTYVVHSPGVCGPLVSAVSRRVHGTAGTFDIPLALSGQPGEEVRAPDVNNQYHVVLTFDRTVNVPVNAGATVTGGSASVTAGPAANQVTVDLTGAPNAHHLAVGVSNMADYTGALIGNLSIPMNLLVGDTNGDGSVNSADITQVKSQSGTSVTASNFREDLNADGGINSADISLVKSTSGTALPPGAMDPTQPTSSQPASTPPPARTARPPARMRSSRLGGQ